METTDLLGEGGVQNELWEDTTVTGENLHENKERSQLGFEPRPFAVRQEC